MPEGTNTHSANPLLVCGHLLQALQGLVEHKSEQSPAETLVNLAAKRLALLADDMYLALNSGRKLDNYPGRDMTPEAN